MRSRALAIAAVLACVFVWSCGGGYGSGPSPSPSGGGTTTTITITGENGSRSFSPNPAAFGGQMVVFRNNDRVVHRVVLNDGSVDTGDIVPGATSRAVLMPGEGTNYHCSLHPTMVGADTIAQPRNVYAPLATMITNTPYLSASGYVNIPALPTATPKDSLYQFQVFPTGSGTLAFRTTSTQRGAVAPGGATYGPQPGVQIPGSVLTAILFPATTAGSPARTSSNANPGVLVIPDKALNP